MHDRLRTSALALILGLVLLAPSSLATLCATDAHCEEATEAAAPAPAPTEHHAGMDSSCCPPSPVPETPEPEPELCCCPDQLARLEDEPAVATSSESLASPGVAATSGGSAPLVAPAARASCRSGPGDPSPCRPAGRALLALHQTFLN